MVRMRDRTVALFPAASISLRLFSAVRAELAPFKQRQIADVLGVTEGRVSQMMGGGQNWTLDTITRLLMAAEKLNRADPPFPKSMASGHHWTRREGDETACSCGKRWPSDEEHP